MLPVVHVVSVVDVVDIDVVSPVPGRRPCFRAGIDHTEPVAPELESGIAFDYDDGNLVDVEPVAAAEVGVEAIWRNTVSVVAAALVPGAMLTLPIMRTLAFPDVLPHIARSGIVPSYLTKFHRAMGAVHVRLGSTMDRLMEFVRLLVMMFRAISWVVARMRLRGVRAFVLVRIRRLSVRAALFVTSRPAVLSTGKTCCSQQQSED